MLELQKDNKSEMLSKMQNSDKFCESTEINRDVFGYKTSSIRQIIGKNCKNWRYKFRKENQ